MLGNLCSALDDPKEIRHHSRERLELFSSHLEWSPTTVDALLYLCACSPSSWFCTQVTKLTLKRGTQKTRFEHYLLRVIDTAPPFCGLGRLLSQLPV